MGKIKQLSLHEAQKIAAGEVVERPANVVKELIENALDADATRISIYVRDGGHTFIRVVDNGHGMDADDAQACFNHHATSKIETVNDFETLSSFGFRGEALASIAAVSTVTLITKEHSALHGIKIIREGLTTKETTDIASAPGTDITVENLFYNVPARKKFLKKEETEWRQIVQLVQAMCFARPDIHVSLYDDARCVYQCPAVKTIAERAAQLWQEPKADQLLLLPERQDNTTAITGVISTHQWYRYDRNFIHFFVNKRWIKNQPLASALLKGYLNVLPAGRYPAAVIAITIDPATIDVNIHPRKQEVQFLHPRTVEQLLQTAVKETLQNHISQQLRNQITWQPAQSLVTTPHSSIKFPVAPPSGFTTTYERTLRPVQDEPFPVKESAQPASEYLQEKVIELTNTAFTEQLTYTFIGHYASTYLLTETTQGLFIIDQHAAHERILYEQFKARFGSIALISCAFPEIITIATSDMPIIVPHLEHLAQHGLLLEQFGSNQLIIKATAAYLNKVSGAELVKEIIALLHEQQGNNTTIGQTLREKIHAQMACKAAVKAGDELSQEQIEQLLFDLAKTENRLACPHGRPTGWLLSHDDLERKFKRKV